MTAMEASTMHPELAAAVGEAREATAAALRELAAVDPGRRAAGPDVHLWLGPVRHQRLAIGGAVARARGALSRAGGALGELVTREAAPAAKGRRTRTPEAVDLAALQRAAAAVEVAFTGARDARERWGGGLGEGERLLLVVAVAELVAATLAVAQACDVAGLEDGPRLYDTTRLRPMCDLPGGGARAGA